MHISPENLRSDAHAPQCALRFGARLSSKLHYSTEILSLISNVMKEMN